MKIADLRSEYMKETLDETDVAPDPLREFEHWFDEAVKGQVPEPNAMTLATVDDDGRPAARIVLLKACDPRGFVFFTNYASRKGRELGANAHAALLFYWAELERQIRIEGVVTRVPDAESDAYFASRPRASRLGAWASAQSEPVTDRAALEASFAATAARFDAAGEHVPRPPHWGGYVLAPTMLEFWQGRRSRMHDRVRYRRNPAHPGAWSIDRLAP